MQQPSDNAKVNYEKIDKGVNNYNVEILIEPEAEQQNQDKCSESSLTMQQPSDNAKVNYEKIDKGVNNYNVEIPIEPEAEQQNQDKCSESSFTMQQPSDNAKVNYKKIDKGVNNYNVEIPIEPEAEQQNQDKGSEPSVSNYVKTPKRVACEVCDKKFKYQCELRDHMRAHTGEKPFKCIICKHAFKRRYLLNKHMITIHETDRYEKSNTCAVCDQQFPQKEDLLKHLETHVTQHDENTFSCCVCGNKFQRKSSLIWHIKRHSDENYTCDICKRTFKYKDNYETHMRLHAMQKTKPVNFCKICNAEFTHKNVFDSHMRLHTGEKPFSCDTCEQRFAFKVALVKHVCIDGERPYMKRLEANTLCSKCHTQLPNQTISQAGEKPLCELCNTKYAFEVPVLPHTSTSDNKQNIREEMNIQTVKVEKNETWIEVSGRIESETEIKKEIEGDKMESDTGIAEIKKEMDPIQPEINEEF